MPIAKRRFPLSRLLPRKRDTACREDDLVSTGCALAPFEAPRSQSCTTMEAAAVSRHAPKKPDITASIEPVASGATRTADTNRGGPLKGETSQIGASSARIRRHGPQSQDRDNEHEVGSGSRTRAARTAVLSGRGDTPGRKRIGPPLLKASLESSPTWSRNSDPIVNR